MTNLKYELLDKDNSTGNFVLLANGEPIAEFYQEADATLTLAAPELLDTLKRIRDAKITPVSAQDFQFVARAAIAKAEGK